MNEIIDVINTHESMIYTEFEATIEMLSGAIFIAVIAGFFIGMTLYNLKRVNGVMNLITAPFRLMMHLIGDYPVIVVAILLVPFLQENIGTITGIEAAQPILMFWGAFYFASLLYRSFTTQEEDERMPAKVVKSLRSLVIGMISASAVLGMIGMGGLGGILLNYGFFQFDYYFAIVIAIIYAGMILAVEFIAMILLIVLSPARRMTAAKETEKVTRTPQVEKVDLEKAQAGTQEPRKASQSTLDIDALIRRK